MPEYRTRLINSEFDVTDDGSVHDSLEAASRSAVLAALDIAKGLYANGEEQPRIEIEILGEGEVLARHVVKLSILAGEE